MVRNPRRVELTVFAVVVLEMVVFGVMTFGVAIFGVTTFGVTVRFGVSTRFVVRVFWVPSCLDVIVLELDVVVVVVRGVEIVLGVTVLGVTVLGVTVLGVTVLGAPVPGAAAFLPAG
jgi:hypothetical protein